MLLFTSSNKEKAARTGAAIAGLTATPYANVILSCKTGAHTNKHLNEVFFKMFMKDSKKLKSASKKKGLIGAAACRYAVGLLLSAAELYATDGALLSQEMIGDECSTDEWKTKGKTWVLSKCGN